MSEKAPGAGLGACRLGGKTDNKAIQSGVLSAPPEARCFGNTSQVSLSWERHLLSYTLNLVEKEVNPPKRMGKSDVGRKSYLCSEGKKEYDTSGKQQEFHCCWSIEW